MKSRSAIISSTIVATMLLNLAFAQTPSGRKSAGDRVIAPLIPAAVASGIDDDHDGIDDGLEQMLAELYAPIIFIEHDESNYPVNVEWFLARGHLQYHEDCTIDIDDDRGSNPIGSQANLLGPPGALWAGGPNCGEDDTGYSHPPHRQLTTIAADPDGQFSVGPLTTGYSDQQTFVIPDLDDQFRVGSTNPLDWKSYFHVYPGADGGVMIQYWHLFAYNELGVAGIGDHGGDWDASIQVQLDQSLQLEGIWFSRHDHDHPGDFIDKNNPRLHFLAGTLHPLMAIDGGGHAAFANPDDFCDNHASIAGGQIAWPFGSVDPTNPANLSTFATKLGGCEISDDAPGGIVWETWTGGSVLASGNITHPISSPSLHGGLINLGEYNPCTDTRCFGTAQASSLLAGEFHPLNGQIFLRYSGKWGSLPHIQNIAGQPPRGPVFQGFEDRGPDHTSIYTAWYNQGANQPAANDGNHPWLVPPTTTISSQGPTFTFGGTTCVSATTGFSLAANQNAIATRFGSSKTFFRVFPAGTAAPAFGQFSTPFSLSGPDGIYEIDYYSVDALNNVSPVQSALFNLDTTPPAMSCPPNIIINTVNQGDPTVVVTFPAPAATDACSVASVVCSPPSGSQFGRGTTTVTCTATDGVLNQSTCAFTVTVFDSCLQDDTSGDFIRWNSSSGAFLFTHCGSNAFTLAGTGVVGMVNNVRTLTDTEPDHRINASLNMGQLTGRAVITLIPGPGIFQNFLVNQTNPHPRCSCP